MYTFEPLNTHNLFSVTKRYILKIIYSMLLLVLFAIIFKQFFHTTKSHFVGYCVVELIYIIHLVSEDYINKIEINPTTNKIYFEHYAITTGITKNDFNTKDIQVKFDESGKGEIVKIDFYKDNKHLLEVNRKKTNF